MPRSSDQATRLRCRTRVHRALPSAVQSTFRPIVSWQPTSCGSCLRRDKCLPPPIYCLLSPFLCLKS
ncbi:unnamed protein product [Urochloa humidicola]